MIRFADFHILIPRGPTKLTHISSPASLPFVYVHLVGPEMLGLEDDDENRCQTQSGYGQQHPLLRTKLNHRGNVLATRDISQQDHFGQDQWS